MVFSRLSRKGQVTLPKEIRQAMHAAPGDLVAYEIAADGQVLIRKVTPLDLAFHNALNPTLEEWETEGDNKAYRDL